MSKVEVLKELQKLVCGCYCTNAESCQSYDLARNCPIHKKFNELLEILV